MTFQELDTALKAKGWRRVTPPGKRGVIDSLTIDRQSCEEETCQACGKFGQEYVCYITEVGDYTPVCRCPDCQEAYAF